MTRFILSEQILWVPSTLKWRYFVTLDDALDKMYNRYLKYIHSSKTANLWLFQETDGCRSLLCSVECNPLFFDDEEEST